MTDDEAIKIARHQGLELIQRPVGGKWCWGFVRENDELYPAFGERRQAISYMRDWLRRGHAFA